MPRSPFQPSRLRLARSLRGLTQAALAEKSGVSAAAISQFESGSAAPGPETAQQVAVVLGCKLEFFLRPGSAIKIEAPFFRSLRSTPQIERDQAHAYAKFLIEAVEQIESFVDLPEVAIPNALETRIDHLDPAADIETTALRLRVDWQIPPGPIANVVRLIESKGAVSTAVGAFSKKLDAFSMRTSIRPVLVLCSQKGIAARRRFDAAHELGHLVLHREPVFPNREQEQQAHRFASAFLMPAEEVEGWLPTKSSQLELLQEGSQMWGVSMQALLRRGRDLGTLSEADYQRTMKRMSAMGWRSKEPVDIGPPERPELLTRAVEVLGATGGSLHAIANEMGIASKRMARMLSLPEDRTEEPEAEVVDLRSAAA